MKNKRNHFSLFRTLVATLIAAFVAFAPIASVRALDIQPLPIETASVYGYNWKAKITFQDLTNAAGAIKTIQLLPLTGNYSTGMVVSAVAYNVTQQFTNTTADNTNLLVYIGINNGLTNLWASALDIDVRTLQARL